MNQQKSILREVNLNTKCYYSLLPEIIKLSTLPRKESFATIEFNTGRSLLKIDYITLLSRTNNCTDCNTFSK